MEQFTFLKISSRQGMNAGYSGNQTPYVFYIVLSRNYTNVFSTGGGVSCKITSQAQPVLGFLFKTL